MHLGDQGQVKKFNIQYYHPQEDSLPSPDGHVS
jgi:hypothetical protein